MFVANILVHIICKTSIYRGRRQVVMGKLPVFTPEGFCDIEIQYIFPYHPYRNEDGEINEEFMRPLDGYFLDLKEGKTESIKYFFKVLCDLLHHNEEIIAKYYLCAVPSSNPYNVPSPVQRICTLLSQAFDKKFDYSCALKRVEKINKLATGGARNPQIHFNSIEVDSNYDVEGINIILLDDITTTGNSLAACKKILLRAGASDVICLAIGRTTRL